MRKRQQMQWLQGLGGVAGIALIGVAVLYFGGIRPAQARAQALHAQIAVVEADIAADSALRPMAAALEERLAQFEALAAAAPRARVAHVRIGELVAEFEAAVLGATLADKVSTRMRLRADTAATRAILRIEGTLQFSEITELLSKLSAWPYRYTLRQLNIESTGNMRTLRMEIAVEVEG